MCELSFCAFTFDLELRSKVKRAFVSNISKNTRDLICIVNIKEIIYWLSFHAMTFDLELRSEVSSNFSKTMRD